MKAQAIGIANKVISRIRSTDWSKHLSAEDMQIVEEITHDLSNLTLDLAATAEDDMDAKAKIIIEMNHCKSALESYDSLKKAYIYEKICQCISDVLKIAARGAILLM
jgi:hypothetical protein